MKNLTSFLIVVMSCSFAFMGAQTHAQDVDNANVESDQLEATILQLRRELTKLERGLDTDAGPASLLVDDDAEASALTRVRSGNGVFDDSQATQAVDSVPAQLYSEGHSVALNSQNFQYQPQQQSFQYQQGIPVGTLPANSTWLDQSIPMAVMPTQSVLMPIAAPIEYSQPTPVQPVYAAPAIEYSQPAPIVQQPVTIQQAPVPQVSPTIIVNIYQQAPAPRNTFTAPIMAPIYGPAPIRVSAPRRGCCLFGRR